MDKLLLLLTCTFAYHIFGYDFDKSIVTKQDVICASQNSFDILTFADITFTNNPKPISIGDYRAIFTAAKNGRINILSLLLKKGIDINCENSNGETPLRIAVINGKTDAALFLIRNGAKIYDRILEEALNSDAQDMFQKLITQGVELKFENAYRPLLISALQNNNLEVVDFLLANKAYPDNAISDEMLVDTLNGKCTNDDVMKKIIAFAGKRKIASFSNFSTS